jgi:8-oxo-dGTP pyrophosphatase MutT (NUDIX family)
MSDSPIPETRSAGGIVLGDNGTIALVQSRNSKSWLFPKGHVEAGESDEEAARREIHEEAGLTDLELIDDLGEFSRPTVTAKGLINEHKTVKMYLFAAPAGSQLAPTMEIAEARWVNYREVPELLGAPHTDWFAADRAWFASVFDRVREAIQRD